MQYNTNREQLIIPEYGRHIQKMVDYCKTISDKEERNDFANAIIEVMGNLNPHLRDVGDFKHILWDQLFIMASFDLDVESPYPIPTIEKFTAKPNRVEYPVHVGKYRYYGNNIKKMIDVATTWEEGDKKVGLVKNIANQMKKSYLLYNKDTVDDQVIYDDLKRLSNGKLDIEKIEEESEHNIQLSSHDSLTQNKPRYNKPRKTNYKRRTNRS